MKKFFAILGICVAATGFTFAGDRHITKQELPVEARAFLSAHYGQTGIAYATVDREVFDTTYAVSLNDGTRLEFSRNGDWMEIKSPRGGKIPMSAIPEKIASYIKKNYPKADVRQIEIDGRDCEVALSNGVEITFDRKLEMVRTNDWPKYGPNHRFTWRDAR